MELKSRGRDFSLRKKSQRRAIINQRSLKNDEIEQRR